MTFHHQFQNTARDHLLQIRHLRHLPLHLRPLQRPWLLNVNPHPLRHNLPNRADKPLPRRKQPSPHRADKNNPDRYDRIIERIFRHWVSSRETENDRDEADPENGDEGDGAGEEAEVEGAFFEVGWVEEADENGDAVGDVEADGGDGSGGGEGYRGAEGREGEAEGEGCGKPDCSDRASKSVVYLVEKSWNTTITAEGKHHPAVASHGEKPTMPNTDHDQTHQYHCAIRTKNIHQNLKHWLSIRTAERIIEVLDRE